MPHKMSERERVAWLLRKLWSGSQSRMAADVGVSQSTISNVVSGRRAPGRKILTAISAHPLVNGAWLLSGEGEPLVAEEQPGRGGQYFCPVAAMPLAGHPRDFREQLTGQYRPVAAAEFGEDRYWFFVGDEQFVDKNVVPGDWLLMDAGRSWLNEPQKIVGQPCVVRTGGQTHGGDSVRWLAYDSGKFAIDVLSAACEPERSDGRRLRGIRSRRQQAKSKPAKAARIALKDIVAVAVKLERPWLGHFQ